MRKTLLLAFSVFCMAHVFTSCSIAAVPSRIKLAIKLSDKTNVVFETNHWYLALKEDQTYLGACTIRLKRVEGMFGFLTESEEREFFPLIRAMEDAAKKRFCSTHLNWMCYMNHGYRTIVPMPLVHVHFYPRYLQGSVPFAGLIFTDPNPTSPPKSYSSRIVPKNVMEEIKRAYQKEFGISPSKPFIVLEK